MFEYLMVFLLGGAGYCLIEVLWRGFTHWSMALAGGERSRAFIISARGIRSRRFGRGARREDL